MITESGLRTEFRISGRWQLPDPTAHIREVAKTVATHFAALPGSMLPFDNEARKVMLGNQVVQSVRAQLSTSDSSTAALHANAAGQQGVQAGLVALLDFGAGADILDTTTNLPMVSVEHVNCARRLVDISVAIREMWREELDRAPASANGAEGWAADGASLAHAVHGNYSQNGFDVPLGTQAPPAEDALPEQQEDEPELQQIWQAEMAAAGEEDAAEEVEDAAVADEAVAPLRFEDLPGEEVFDNTGLGPNGTMLFAKSGTAQVHKDRRLMRRLLLSGKSHTTINQLVDASGAAITNPVTNKKRKVRPSKRDTEEVLKAAFAQFPRLGTYTAGGGDREVVLKGWPLSVKGGILFHNELMRCCRVPLQQVSQKRAEFHDAPPRVPHNGGEGMAEEGGGNDAEADGLNVPAAMRQNPPTPPQGVGSAVY